MMVKAREGWRREREGKGEDVSQSVSQSVKESTKERECATEYANKPSIKQCRSFLCTIEQ